MVHAVKAQSAMEYLMTYGWAILIIAIALAALYSLGIFNSNTFTPKAQPGSCSVYRPYGAGSTQFISTEATCNGEEPKFVGVFNGETSYIVTPSISLGPSYTMIIWMDPRSYTSSAGALSEFVEQPGKVLQDGEFTASGQVLDGMFISGTYYSYNSGTLTVPLNRWSFVAYTLSGSTLTFYVNGRNYTQTTAGPASAFTNPVFIGTFNGLSRYVFNGSVANVQIYNTALSQPEINSQYDAGIGGAPIKLQNLIGWWPLNGNANDYSGDGNDGTTTNVIYTSSWESSYTQP